MENQKPGSIPGDIEKPGRRSTRMKLDFELEAAETLTCLAQSSNHKDGGADLAPIKQAQAEISFVDKKVILPEMKQRPHGSGRGVVRELCFTAPEVFPTRPQLTEAEKEAKQLRRKLANRESARATIRRRQMIHENLSRKKDALSLENENLKRQAQEMLREYHSLKEKNEALKKVVAEFGQVQKEAEPDPDAEPTEGVVSGTPATTALLFPSHGQPSPVPAPAPVPVMWQSMIQIQPQSIMMYHVPEPWRQYHVVNNSGTSSITVPNPGGGPLLYVLHLLPVPPQPAPPAAPPVSASSNPAQIQHLCHQCGAGAASRSSTPSINREDKGKAVADDPDKGALLSVPLSRAVAPCASGSGRGKVIDFKTKTVQSSSGDTAPAGWSLAKTAKKRAAEPDPLAWMAEVPPPAEARKRRKELMKTKSLRLGQSNVNKW